MDKASPLCSILGDWLYGPVEWSVVHSNESMTVMGFSDLLQ